MLLNHTTIYRWVLNIEAERNMLRYENVEQRLEELLQLNIERLYNVYKYNSDAPFLKSQEDLDKFIGYGNFRNPQPISDEVFNSIKEKQVNFDSEDSYLIEDSSSEVPDAEKTLVTKSILKNKVGELCGGFLGNEYFKRKLLENGFKTTESNMYYKDVLKKEIDNGKIVYLEDVEPRLDELLKLDIDTLKLKIKSDTSKFKTQKDIDDYMGPSYLNSKERRNALPTPLELEKSRNQLTRIKALEEETEKRMEEVHQKNIIKLREIKQVHISIPYNKNKLGSDPLMGALTGDIVAGGAGRMVGGLANAGDLLGSTMGAMSGGLILGGAGALIGGLIAASDDGIRWHDTVLVLKESELVIGGNLSLPYKDIKHISIEKYKNEDIITITIRNGGLQFKTQDAKALKIVMDEMMEDIDFEEESDMLKETVTSTNESNKVDALLKYAELYEKGLLTKEEFETKKKELL